MASDAFTRANETPLAAPWTKQVGDNLNLASNAVQKPSGSADTYWYYSGAATTADEFAQASETAAVVDHDWGPAVRCGGAGHAAAAEGYFFDAYQWGNHPGSTGLDKEVSGAFTTIVNVDTTGYALNDVLRVEAQGTTIRAFRNGTQVASTTDTSITAKGNGVGLFVFGTGGSIDNWSGGDLGGGGTTTPVTLSAAAGSSVTMVKQARKTLAAASASAATLLRVAAKQKTLAASSAGAAVIVRQARKTLAVASASAATVAAKRVKLLTLTATAGSAAVVASVRSRFLTLAATVTASVTLRRAVSKTVLGTTSGQASLTVPGAPAAGAGQMPTLHAG